MNQTSSSAAARFSFPGLNAYVNRLLNRLARDPGASEQAELHRSLDATSRRLEQSLARQQLTTAQLTLPSRQLRGWLAFVANAENLSAYIQAVSRARTIIEPMLAQTRWKPPLRIYLRPVHGMYRMVQQKDGLELSLPTAAICFDEQDWQALGRAAFRGDRAAKRQVIARMQSEVFVAIVTELEALGGTTDDPVGQAYDLNAIFERVNTEYFNGSMPRPRLIWSRSLTFRKFGHYDWIRDAVMLSRSLDSAEVPEFLVDFVMYHELLHKAHGIRWTADSSRAYAHTAAFYRDEKKFTRYIEAEAALAKLARQRR